MLLDQNTVEAEIIFKLNVLPQIVAQINSSKTMPQGCCFQELVIKMDSGPIKRGKQCGTRFILLDSEHS